MSLPVQDAKALTDEFLLLLEQAHGEQIYQAFMERNPQFIPREFIQNHGLHLNIVIRKLSLAKDYTTDFFYLSKSSGDWHCVMVEIEKPHSKYFRSGSNDFHCDFLDALSQVDRWRAWFENASNKSAFVNSTIQPLRVPDGMTRNPCHIKYVLVHGRRSEFEKSEIRTALIRTQERDDFKILSFDSLAEDVSGKTDLYVGVRRNEFIDIVSHRFISDNIFVWVDTNHLRVSQALKDSIIAGGHKYWYRNQKSGEFFMEDIIPKLIVSDAAPVAQAGCQTQATVPGFLSSSTA